MGSMISSVIQVLLFVDQDNVKVVQWTKKKIKANTSTFEHNVG